MGRTSLLVRPVTYVAGSMLAIAALFAPYDAARAEPEHRAGALYVTAGSVHTGTGKVFSPGAVAIEDGKVKAVGMPGDVVAPDGARILSGGPFTAVVPGLVAASTEHLSKAGDDPSTLSPDVLALDGYDFFRDESRVLAGGVTTVFLAPGSRRVVSGRGAVVKTAGASAQSRTLRADTGLVTGVGDAVNRPPTAAADAPVLPDATDNPLLPQRSQLPVTRAGSLLLLRELLEQGRAGDPAAANLVAGRERLRVGADTAGDIEAALALLEEWKLRGVLVGGLESGRVAGLLKQSGQGIVLEWPDPPGRVNASQDADTETARARARGNAAVLAAAGVPFALSTGDEGSLADLHFVAASAARAGLDPEQALAAVTADAAQILGVGDRVGSLATGLDGDLVLLSGPPADLRSFALTTVVDGEVVWERSEAGGTVVVRAAEVHIGDGTVLTPGEVAFEDGKIVEVGVRVGVPPGARLIDLGAGAVIPGLIDAFSHAGLAGSAGGGQASDLSTAVTAAKALSASDPSFALLASEGVTTVLAAPGGQGRVAGRAAVVKTAGADLDARILKSDAGLVVRLRRERDLPAAVKQLDGILKKAKAYLGAHEKYAKDRKEYDAWKKKRDAEAAAKAQAEAKKKEEAEKPKKDAEAKAPEDKKDAGKGAAKDGKAAAKKKQAPEKTEPVQPATDESLAGYEPALKGKVPVLVRASSVEELRAALDLLVKKWKLRVVIVGGEDARRVSKRLWSSKAGVIAAPQVIGTERGRPVNLLRELALTGLPAAVGTDAYLGGAQLNELLAYGVARGLSPATAIAMATGDAAELLGVEKRVGTLAPGHDADLVLLTGVPFGRGSGIHSVFVGGQEVNRDAK